jgi:hypothetical protein
VEVTHLRGDELAICTRVFCGSVICVVKSQHIFSFQAYLCRPIFALKFLAELVLEIHAIMVYPRN